MFSKVSGRKWQKKMKSDYLELPKLHWATLYKVMTFRN